MPTRHTQHDDRTARAAGRRRTRRGSFLILVVGTLALIAVITVVYVAIGRSDRQTSAAALRVEERKNVPAAMRDYIAGIVADDVFDYLFLGEVLPNPDNPASAVPVFRREAWDYPSSAYEVTIPSPIGANQTYPLTISGGNLRADPRRRFNPTGNFTGTDPWLASTEPTLLNYDGQGLSNESEPADYWRERIGWMQMSNIAPDGMPVNRFHLRGNFEATPRELRRDLTVFSVAPDRGVGREQRTDFGVNHPDATTRDAVPAHYFHRQEFAAFPNVDPRIGPDQGLHMLYQLADADGDGILDSRWFEMVEDRDPRDNLFARLLDPEPGVRYFFAVRIVDASARVNVNTATDATLPPARLDPFGLTPAAVDLRSLLTHEHFYTDARVGFGPNAHLQPDYPNNPDPMSPQNYLELTADNAYFAGEKAYDALRMVLDLGVTPGRGYEGLRALDTIGNVNREFSLDGNALSPYWQGNPKLPGLAPSDHYQLFAGYGPSGGLGDLNDPRNPSAVFRPFGLESLEDLLVFGGANDDRVRSPLETTLDGRADPAFISGSPDGDTLALRFGPLRSNRSTELERTRYRFERLRPEFLDQARAALYTDIRQRLTTLSGARPIRPTAVPAEQVGRNFTFPEDRLALTEEDLRRSETSLFLSSQALFELYADALAPYSGLRIGGTSVWDADALPGYATLFYGYRGPHLAVRTAAHLAANMRDLYDTGSAPSIRTLVLNGNASFRDTNLDNAGRNPLYPWRLLDLDASNNTQARRLPENPPASLPNAVNIHGIEAQPFLTEAASFVMYTDTPEALGGDDDTGEFRLNDQTIYRYNPSIDGRVPDGGADNPDFILQALAFQVHNPFDESITLSGNPADPNGIASARRGLYYVQYGDTYFKLTDVSSGAETDITLGRGETRTFYALSQHPRKIAERVHRITGDANYGGRTIEDEQARIRTWINTQFGEEAVQIPTFDRVTGAARIPSESDGDSNVVQLQSGSDAARTRVRLWRVEKPGEDPNNAGIVIQGVDESVLNDPANDTLIDRLREPAGEPRTPVLNRELPPSPNRAGAIDGTQAGPEPPDANASPDNRGLSITRYGVLRRNADPGASEADGVARGAIGAYCIELKDQSGSAANDADDDGSAQGSLDRDDFTGRVGDQTLDGLLAKQTGGDLSNRLVPTLTIDADRKADDARQGIDVKEMPANRAGAPYRSLYPEARLDNDQFGRASSGVSTLRVADILLPLGIGPHQIPDPSFTGGDEDIEWTTLSEALALALNYDSPRLDPRDVYADAFDPNTNEEVLLDRGQLQPDAFVPFFDSDANRLYEPGAGDRRWGLGVPMAATLLDEFTALERRFGSLTSPTHGVLNINTVSRETARAIPGLSPPESSGPDSAAGWWWGDGDHDQRSDIATTMVGYRDKLAIFPRDVDGVDAGTGPLNFRDWWSADLSSRDSLPPEGVGAPGTIAAELAGENARQGATGIRGLSEAPGFRSLGELLLVRDLGYQSNYGSSYADPHSIDRLGFDGRNITVEGIDSVSHTDEFDNPVRDGITDDYDERLALANAALASTSVRSDYFIAWFLVHGYTESDVSGLGQNDPLVPSIARRFLMVIDRSNVVEPGDRPRILLFREVPL